MKRLMNIIALLAMAVQMSAQSTYDVLSLFHNDLTGTARFVGMGGAMSALGGDISVMSYNPAGIGIYRGNDFMASASLNFLDTDADFLGSKLKSDKTSFLFDNIGLVLSANVDDDALKFVNFGLNYTRRNNFRKEFAMNGLSPDGMYSQQWQIQDLAFLCDVPTFGNISSDDYFNIRYAWLPLLACDVNVLDGNYDFYRPTDFTYYSEERGGVDNVDANIAVNIEDRFYFGLTVGMQYIDYERNTVYGEYDDNGVIYDLSNRFKTEGSGYNLKLGTIIRPFEYSPFRMGLAFHLPTFYQLTDYSGAYMTGPEDESGEYKTMDTGWYDAYGSDYIVDYRVRSPWRMNVSAAYTFEDFLALDLEYEMVDYSTAKMEYEDGPEMTDMNDEFDSNMRVSHIFRAGAEMKLDDHFSLRCGYNYISSPFNGDAYKYISPASASTATEYTNVKETNIVTLGLGYRAKSVYFDAAYQCAMQSADFFTYCDPDNLLPATEVENVRNKFVLTFGVRF